MVAYKCRNNHLWEYHIFDIVIKKEPVFKSCHACPTRLTIAAYSSKPPKPELLKMKYN